MAWPMATALTGSLPSGMLAVEAVGPAVAELGVEPVLVARVGGDADALGEGGDAVLGRADPLAAVVDRGAVGRGQGQGPPADPFAGLQHHHLGPGVHQPAGGGQPGQAGPDHDDVCCGGQHSLLARVASGCGDARQSTAVGRVTAPRERRAGCGPNSTNLRTQTSSAVTGSRRSSAAQSPEWLKSLWGKGKRMAITESARPASAPSTPPARPPGRWWAPSRSTGPRRSRPPWPGPGRRPGLGRAGLRRPPAGPPGLQGAAGPPDRRAGRPCPPRERQARRRRPHRGPDDRRAPRLGGPQRGQGARPAPGPRQPGAGQPRRLGRVPAPRGGRGHRPLELPGVHPARVDRLRPGRRQRGGVQAERADPGGGLLPGRHLRRGRAATSRCSRW